MKHQTGWILDLHNKLAWCIIFRANSLFSSCDDIALHSASEQQGSQRRLQQRAWRLCKWFTLEWKWGWSHRCLFGSTGPSRVSPTQACPLAAIGLSTNTSDLRSLPNKFAWGKWSHRLLGFKRFFSGLSPFLPTAHKNYELGWTCNVRKRYNSVWTTNIDRNICIYHTCNHTAVRNRHR